MAFATQKLTPILLVDQIEICIPFWTRLGFEQAIALPEGGWLGFVMLTNGPVEVMYQSRTSIARDIPLLGEFPSSTLMYIHVTNLDEVIEKLGDAEVVQPKRVTFYGATECWVREPGGNVIGFSEMNPSHAG
jgi:hypothetical protein